MTNTRVLKNKKSKFDILKKSGLPLIFFIIGGSYGLSIFMQTHFDYKDKKENNISKRNFDLEQEHKKILEQLNIKDFKLSRIPRPGEEINKNSVTGKNINKNELTKQRTWSEWWNGD